MRTEPCHNCGADAEITQEGLLHVCVGQMCRECGYYWMANTGASPEESVVAWREQELRSLAAASIDQAAREARASALNTDPEAGYIWRAYRARLLMSANSLEARAAELRGGARATAGDLAHVPYALLDRVRPVPSTHQK